jgi:hypothetical protein
MEQKINELVRAVSTWAVTGWIEHATLEKTTLVSVILPTHNRSNLLPRAVSAIIAMMGLARAFAQGPRPKRSLLFVWHAGEEIGTYGSLYFVDHPTVPLDKIVAQLNIDMVGRNRNDDPGQGSTVYLVGSDRISTELHNMNEESNSGLEKPMKLDYEMINPADPKSIYTRSDHYSYAAKGIPIAFFTTGLHPDYHRVTDTAEKITYPKMARIGQLMYQSGFGIANTDKVLERDNKGPRAGFGTPMEVIKK